MHKEALSSQQIEEIVLGEGGDGGGGFGEGAGAGAGFVGKQGASVNWRASSLLVC